MRYFIVFFVLFSSGTSILLAQPWMVELAKKKSVEDANFYDIQQAFNAYWKDKKPERGKGYKPFRRWEYFMEPRVYPTGKLPAIPLWQVIREKENRKKFSPAAATEWTFIGPALVSKDINTKEIGGAGRINCIAFHPTDSSTVWIGSPSGGIWKTTNGGETWIPTGDQLSAIGVTDIAVDPQDPDNLYIATGDGDFYDTYSIGILKSSDGGLTWNATSLTQEVSDKSAFRRILMHPTNPAVMIAASYDGIYRTTNAWDSYTKVMDGHFKDLEFKPGNPSVIYAASNAKIYRSSDNGETFAESMLGMDEDINGQVNRIELAVSAANPNVVYALCSDIKNNGFYGLYRSSLSGLIWTKVYGNDKINLLGWQPDGTDVGGQGTYDLAMAVSPTDANDIHIGGVNMWRSTDGGKDWSIISYWAHSETYTYVHADHHMLVYSPHGPILFTSNDGGIYKSYNSGATWKDISNGLNILQTYRFGLSANDPGLIITGNQDNGSIMIDGVGCYEVLGGDGMECFIDYTDDNIIYGTLYYGDLRKSVNRGLSFTSITPSGDLTGAWITPFLMHPSVPGILYAGYDAIYKSTDAGKNWTKIPVDITIESTFRSIAIAPGNDRCLYAASLYTLVKTVDGGSTWTDITAGLPDKTIAGISVSPEDHNKLWVTFVSYTTESQVYFSDDGGLTWVNYSEGLPLLPVNCIVYQKGSHGGLYAGTDIGVYFRDEQMSEWIDYSGNLPNVIVNDLEIDYATSMLKAATYGRGIWQAPVNPVNPDNLMAEFSVTPTYGCANGLITAEDHSLGDPTGYQWDFGEGALPATADTKGPHSVYYESAGEKDITLTVTRGMDNNAELKKGIVTIGASIDFDVAPSSVNSCDNTAVALYATGNYAFTWSPSDGLNSTTGNAVLALPAVNTTYTVTANHGACSAVKEVTVSITTNDAVCDAIPLEYGMNGPFDNSCATKEESEPVPPAGSSGNGCQTQDGWCNGEDRIDNSLWFTFEAPASGIISIESGGFDNQIAVYESPSCDDLSLGTGTMLAANDDYPGKADYAACIEEVNGLTPGQTYWVQVDGSYGGVSGAFYLFLTDSHLSGTKESPSDRAHSIEVFPNPSQTGLFNLRMEENQPSGFQLVVRSVSGDVVFSEDIPSYAASVIIPLNLTGFLSGLYMLEIHGEKGIYHTKILIP